MGWVYELQEYGMGRGVTIVGCLRLKTNMTVFASHARLTHISFSCYQPGTRIVTNNVRLLLTEIVNYCTVILVVVINDGTWWVLCMALCFVNKSWNCLHWNPIIWFFSSKKLQCSVNDLWNLMWEVREVTVDSGMIWDWSVHDINDELQQPGKK